MNNEHVLKGVAFFLAPDAVDHVSCTEFASLFCKENVTNK